MDPKRYKKIWFSYFIPSFLAGGASMSKEIGIWNLPVKTMVDVNDTS
ncbi:hypothetical protein [Enterococcus haemoperoxidus]|nr:hypothetical protein [Enterococcus haemoperoxidus]OJG56255.1 hypothetical protein RV06_GL000371 [Enterococcus haemoperoxidus]